MVGMRKGFTSYGYPLGLILLVEKTVFFSVTLVENQLTINVRVYFWALNSCPIDLYVEQ